VADKRQKDLGEDSYRVRGQTPISEAQALMARDAKRLLERALRLAETAERSNEDVDREWLRAAKIDLERAFMALNRGILKPARVQLPEDTEKF
jgi:hypothetical protein